MPTETIIRTLKEAKQENPKHILPRTVLKAIADKNGDFVSSDVTAQDINQLHGKTLVTANQQTLTDAQKAQARENINAAAPDGYYGNSGGVYQYSTNFIGKNTPQNASNVVFRPTASQMSGQSWSAGSISGQTATIEKIKGKTLVFNQLVKNGNFADSSEWYLSGATISDGILTITGTGSNQYNFIRTDNYIVGHKYLTLFKIKSSQTIPIIRVNSRRGALTDAFQFISLEDVEASNWTILSSIRTATDTANKNAVNIVVQLNVGQIMYVDYLMLIDLTQMYGAGNEPATVKEFRAMFPLDYYDYNEGELISFNGTGLQTTGFNQLKPDGTINVIGGMTYRIEGAYTSLVDSAGNAVTVTDNEFTPSQDDTYTMVGGSCVHLKWSGVRDGDTEDYWQRTLALPIATYFPEGMRGAGTAYDELTKDKAIKRIGVVDLGTLDWRWDSENEYFFAHFPYAKLNTPMTCERYTYSTNTGRDKTIWNRSLAAYSDNILLYDSAYSGDAAALKASLNGVMVNHCLITPVETPISPELNLTYKVDDFGTEKLLPENTAEPVTAPMDADIVYQLDYEAQVRNNDRINISKASMDNFIASFNASGLGTITQTYNPSTKQYEYTVTAQQPEPTEGGETV